MSLNSICSGGISSLSASSAARVSKYSEPRRFGLECTKCSPPSGLWGVGVCRLGCTSEKARSCPEAVKDSTGLERSNADDDGGLEAGVLGLLHAGLEPGGYFQGGGLRDD